MNSEYEKHRQRADLLQMAADLIATRDELLTCAELLREYQFDTDTEGRRAAASLADELIARVKGEWPAQRRS